jgi:hypothetical protein
MDLQFEGRNLDDTVNFEGIRSSAAYIALVTDSYINDARCYLEKEYAISLGKPFIVLVKGDTEIPAGFFKGAFIILEKRFNDIQEITRKDILDAIDKYYEDNK